MAADTSLSLLAASLTAATIVGMSLLVSTALSSSSSCLERLFLVAAILHDEAPRLLPMLTVVDVLTDDGPPFFLRELRVIILKI